MPSPLECAAIRASPRDVVTDAVGGGLAAEVLDQRLAQVGEGGGRYALFALAGLSLNGMVDLKDAIPGARIGGIAGYVQTESKRFGEPHASIINAILTAMRHGAAESLESMRATESLDEVWKAWGAAAVSHGLSILVLLYSEVASRRGISIDEAWQMAAAKDETDMDAALTSPAVEAEQRLWDAGFTQEGIDALTARLATVVMGVQESGAESVSLADLADTPEKEAAIRAFAETIRSRRGESRGGNGPPENGG